MSAQFNDVFRSRNNTNLTVGDSIRMPKQSNGTTWKKKTRKNWRVQNETDISRKNVAAMANGQADFFFHFNRWEKSENEIAIFNIPLDLMFDWRKRARRKRKKKTVSDSSDRWAYSQCISSQRRHRLIERFTFDAFKQCKRKKKNCKKRIRKKRRRIKTVERTPLQERKAKK